MPRELGLRVAQTELGWALTRRWLGRPWLRWLALLGLVLVSLLYCWPGHPSAHGLASDALAHVVLFAAVAPLCWVGVQRGLVALLLAGLLGLLLEVVQWRLGGYALLEWPDVAANELGAALGLGLVWLGGRWRRNCAAGADNPRAGAPQDFG